MTGSKNFTHLARYHCRLVNLRSDELVSRVLVLASGSTLAWHLEEPVLPMKARQWLLPSEAGDKLDWVLVEFGMEQVLMWNPLRMMNKGINQTCYISFTRVTRILL